MRRFFVGSLANQMHSHRDFGAIMSATGAALNPFLFTSGGTYRGQLPLQVAVSKPGKSCGWAWSVSMVPIVDDAVLTILRDVCPGDFEALPVQVQPEGTASVINVLSVKDCIDPTYAPSASEVKGRDLRILYPVRIDVDALGPVHLARATRALSALLISRELKCVLEASRVSGIQFLETV